VEAISIHTGDDDHREPFLRAAAAGKHVLIEKPLANTEQDICDMVAAADRASPRLKIQVGYVLRFNPAFEAIHRMVREGRLGRVYYMECDYVHNLLYQKGKTDPVTGHNWYLERELPMVGGGSHQLDLLRWFTGREVVSVQAGSNHLAFPEMRSDDCMVALFRFDDGSLAKVAALYAPRCARPPFGNLRLYGVQGTVERDQVAVAAGDDDVHPAFSPIEGVRVQGHPFEGEIADWLDAILYDRPTRTGLHDGANSTIAALCAVRAAAEGRAVDVPVFRPLAHSR
jgi:predicted dehydrogenase